jgi:hypothetical protein
MRAPQLSPLMSNEEPSLSVRPTQSQRKKNLLKDLEKPGWIVIGHDGVIITKPVDPQENKKDVG